MNLRGGGAFLGALFVAACGQRPPRAVEPGADLLAIRTLPANAKLVVSSGAFANGGDIPFESTQYRGNKFPGLAWSAGPAGTVSYVVIMQDGDGMSDGAPLVHWTIVNVADTSLAAGLASPPAGSSYGPNMKGMNQPYAGPRTPAGPKHRYHFQVFALEALLAESANYGVLTAAMKGHVLASGELVGLSYVAPAK